MQPLNDTPALHHHTRACVVSGTRPEPHPVSRRIRLHHWCWAIGLVLTALIGIQNASAFTVCGNGICESNGVPPETSQSCWQDCGGTDPCPNACEQGSCDRPASGVDQDYDNVPDRLEYDLAHHFFPNLWLETFSYDLDESYVTHRSIPYKVSPKLVSGTVCGQSYQCLEIRYGMAFFYDHGDGIWPFDDVFSHMGDDEFHAVLVRRTTSYATAKTSTSSWRLIRDMTLAHEGHSTEERTIGAYGYRPPVTCAQDWACYGDLPRSSRATIYASEKKHAMYHTIGECDNGAYWFDHCDNNYNLRNYKVPDALQNIGSYTYRANFDRTIQNPSWCGSYDVWSTQPFGDSPTGYRNKFLNSINWCLPSSSSSSSGCSSPGGGGGGGGYDDPPIHPK